MVTGEHIVAVAGRHEQLADFARCLDHENARTSFITTKAARGSVPNGAAGVGLVQATDDVGAVRAALRELADRHGRPSGIVALTGDELFVAAVLREEHACPGPTTAGLLRLRDRYEMHRAVAAAGLPVPAFAEVEDARQIVELGEAAGWPLVVGPRTGGSAADTVVVAGPADLDGVDLRGRPMMARVRRSRPVYHVDGVFTGSELARWRVSRHLTGLSDRRTGLGSVEVDDAELARAIAGQAAAYLSALTPDPTTFHLELFVEGQACEFREVSAAIGGAEISSIWRELHSCDLAAAAVRLQLGLPVAGPEPVAPGGPVGGWLLMPAPAKRPCRITEATSMLGREPGPYAETVLRPGDVLAAGTGEEHPGGRFRFRGTSTAGVEEAIAATAAAFRIDAEPERPRRPAAERDYSKAILPGPGDSDYARYMKTDTLLSLQRTPSEMVHRDELLFQTVHQSTELWLKHSCFEAREAAVQMRAGELERAARLLARSSLSIELITSQLEMLRHMAPWDFQTIRTVLGHGSGFESPGWRDVQAVSRQLANALKELLDQRGVRLAEVYRGSPDAGVYRLAEALIEWDERIAVWRTRHYKIAIRVIGHEVVGTKGTEVDSLVRLIAHKFFPELWSVRTELTRTGPMGEAAGPV